MSARAVPWPVLVLIFNAFTWGMSWWPLRQLEARGLHPLWATALIYLLAVLCISAWRHVAARGAPPRAGARAGHVPGWRDDRRDAGAGAGTRGLVSAPPAPAWPWMLGVLALGLLFLLSNLALQYGAARLSANVTAVVMVTEVLFASASALWLGAGRLSLPLLVGGTLIVAAALLAVAERAGQA